MLKIPGKVREFKRIVLKIEELKPGTWLGEATVLGRGEFPGILELLNCGPGGAPAGIGGGGVGEIGVAVVNELPALGGDRTAVVLIVVPMIFSEDVGAG